MLGFVAFPAMVVVFVLAEPLLRMWVGRSVQNPAEFLPPSVILVKIMVIGLTCRAVSDGWMKLFYGAGHIRKYAPYVFAGGLFNPVLSILFIYFLPEDMSYAGAAIAYSLVFLVVHMFLMPKVTSTSVGLTLGAILRPSARPLLLAIAVSPSLYVSTLFTENEAITWIGVIFGCCSYAMVYAIASWWLMLSRQERRGIILLTHQVTRR
jgi:Na+-driven multidrug efflux pump